MPFSEDANQPWFWEEGLALSWGVAALSEVPVLAAGAWPSRSIDHSPACVALCVCEEKKREGERVISHRSKCFFALL